jgi:hypothetical protein
MPDPPRALTGVAEQQEPVAAGVTLRRGQPERHGQQAHHRGHARAPRAPRHGGRG